MLWLLAACFALDGALLAAKPLPVVAAKATVETCHHDAAHSSIAGAGHAVPYCCHGGGDCACAGAHVLAEVARLSIAAAAPLARDAVRASAIAFAPRDVAPPLRPPIA